MQWGARWCSGIRAVQKEAALPWPIQNIIIINYIERNTVEISAWRQMQLLRVQWCKTTDTLFYSHMVRWVILHFILGKWVRACAACIRAKISAWIMDPLSEEVQWLCNAVVNLYVSSAEKVTSNQLKLFWVITFVLWWNLCLDRDDLFPGWQCPAQRVA